MTPPIRSSRQRISQVTGVAAGRASAAPSSRPSACASTRRCSPPWASAWRRCAPPSPTPTPRPGRRASTATSRRSPSTPTTQLRTAEDYGAIVLKTQRRQHRAPGRRRHVEHGTRNTRSAAMFDRQPAVLLIIRKQPDANVIDTVDSVKALLPDLQRWIPAGIDITVLSDRTATIRASVHDMQFTLCCRHRPGDAGGVRLPAPHDPTLAAGITVPLSLAGTCAAMWALGYSVNNLTLMAFAIAVGFVVDDAIVMIENVYRNMEHGMKPMQAALVGARQIGFTVLSISVSLVAAFIPRAVHGRRRRPHAARVLGDAGRRDRRLGRRVADRHADDLRPLPQGGRTARHGAASTASSKACSSAMVYGYARTLAVALRNQAVTLFCAPLHRRAHGASLHPDRPKGLFPEDDTGLIIGQHRSGRRHLIRGDAQAAGRGARHHPRGPRRGARRLLGRRRGARRRRSTTGRMFINLKPLAERGGRDHRRVINRLRDKLDGHRGPERASCSPRATSASARDRATRSTSSRSGIPTSTSLTHGRRRCSTRMQQIPGLVRCRRATARQADCSST